MCNMQQAVPRLEEQPLFLQVATQQVTISRKRIGKFFASQEAFQAAWVRFIDFNAHVIQRASSARGQITLNDGTVYIFRKFASIEEAYRISGDVFYTVDVDAGLTDRQILDYIQSRVRWAH